MVDVYIGVVGIPESNIELSFKDMAEASLFSDMLMGAYKKEKKYLYIGIDNSPEYSDMDIMYQDTEQEEREIDATVFDEIIKLQEALR